LLYFERKFKKLGYDLILGVDEAGRGPLAGPVVAAAVSLKTVRFKNRIDDSKRLTSLQRERAFDEIIEKSFFGIGIMGEGVIDRVNILVATQRAMEGAITQALKQLMKRNRRIHVLVDGPVMLDIALPFTNIIKGDARSKSIACASILAKVTRDRIMSLYDSMYPQYGFLKHKGYPTKLHRDAIQTFGPCAIHRVSFLS